MFARDTKRPAQTIAGKMFYTPYLNNSGRIQDLQISNPKGVSVDPMDKCILMTVMLIMIL